MIANPRRIFGRRLAQQSLSDLSASQQTRLRRAAKRFRVASEEVAELSHGRGVVTLLVGRKKRLPAFDHFPEDDVIDRANQSQYFLHAHEPIGSEIGHFHLFKRANVRIEGKETRVTTHLLALAMSAEGEPLMWFGTNRWVTDEYWMNASQTLAAFKQWKFDVEGVEGVVGRWLTALVALYEPEIRALLRQRDAVLGEWIGRHPGENVLEDRRLELIGATKLQLHRRLRDASKQVFERSD
jgi:hypothetical protein